MDRIHRIIEVLKRFQTAVENRPQMMLMILALLIIIGVITCVLGYRLLRFYMMLGGTAIGAVLGFLIMDSIENADQNYYIFGTAGIGIIFGIITFFIYRVGIFAVGAVVGFILSFYFLHPMTYQMLFVCMLVGCAIGALTLKYSRVLIILATSILGGIMAGMAGIKLAGVPMLPWGGIASIVVIMLGLLIQFKMNQTDNRDAEKVKRTTV